MLKEPKRLTIRDASHEEEDDDDFIALLEEIDDNKMCDVCRMPLVKFEDNGMSRKYVCMNQHITIINAMYQYN